MRLRAVGAYAVAHARDKCRRSDKAKPALECGGPSRFGIARPQPRAGVGAAPSPGHGLRGATDLTPRRVPGAKATGLRRRSPLKGLGTLRSAACRIESAWMSPS